MPELNYAKFLKIFKLKVYYGTFEVLGSLEKRDDIECFNEGTKNFISN